MKRIVTLFLICLLVLSICTVQGTGKADDGIADVSFTQIDQETAKEMMRRDDGHVIVDVRRKEEYDAGHIPGAILIPNESIGSDSPEALPDHDQIILIYCRSGNRSKQAAKKLAGMGYANVYEFGGIIDWTGEIVTEGENAAPEPATLSFSSFAGGGYEFTVKAQDTSVVSCKARYEYEAYADELDGASFDYIVSITGLRPGSTVVTVCGKSPIMENQNSMYRVSVDETLRVTLTPLRALSFLYVYRSGEINYDSYEITMDEDGYHVSINENPAQPVSADQAGALMHVIDTYDVVSWDGFSESQRYVLDGEGFWLDFTLTDGTRVHAAGDNAFPEHYFEAMGALWDILTDITGKDNTMRISVTDGTNRIIYQLNDSPSAKSLYEMLPMDIEVDNYGNNEKIFYPDKKIDTADGIEGGGEAGGLALFSPWGNVVMYYGSFAAYPGLYILGQAMEGAEQVQNLSGTIHVAAVE